MKRIWWLIVLAVIIQEPVSTDAVIFQIRHLHLNLIWVNVLWLVATVCDLLIGYVVGAYVRKKIAGSRFERWVTKIITGVENFIGKNGKRFTLVLLGIINFPYANSFLASFLEIPFWEMFSFLLLGDVLYWGIEWIINIGVRSFPISPDTALILVLLVALVFSIVSKIVLKKVISRKK